MPDEGSYWSKIASRRSALRGAALAGGGLAALSLVGCGSSGGGGGAKSAGQNGAAETLDWTKGKPGGSLILQSNNFPPSFDFIGTNSAARVAGFAYSSLLNFKAGRSGVDPQSLELETDVAQAMPEQPNELTYVFKLRPDVKFHNGRQLVAEDVKYSLDAYTTDKSAYKEFYTWLDKVETPDAQTVTVKTKAPYADTLANLSQYMHPFIFAKEHQESAAVNEKMMGSGPFIHTASLAPVSVSFRKNPDYFQKPLPYFDQLSFQVITDTQKQVSDFISRQVQFTWYVTPEFRDQIKQSRPDARSWPYENFGQVVILRTDQAPFTDKRVRQAMSMTIDRKQLRDGVFNGEGQDDQALSLTNAYWGFRKPKDLKSAKYWQYDPTSAKQLLAAAGQDKPFEKSITLSTSAANQQILQQGTLIQAKWKDLGVGNTKINAVTTAQLQSTVNVGRYDDIGMFNNQQVPVVGIWLKNRFWSPPEGVKAPTSNTGYVNNPELSRLFDKQLGQFKVEERKATFREIEEILGEEQYRLALTTAPQTWFVDPSIKNDEVFSWSSSSTVSYTKYWWQDHA